MEEAAKAMTAAAMATALTPKSKSGVVGVSGQMAAKIGGKAERKAASEFIVPDTPPERAGFMVKVSGKAGEASGKRFYWQLFGCVLIYRESSEKGTVLKGLIDLANGGVESVREAGDEVSSLRDACLLWHWLRS